MNAAGTRSSPRVWHVVIEDLGYKLRFAHDPFSVYAARDFERDSARPEVLITCGLCRRAVGLPPKGAS